MLPIPWVAVALVAQAAPLSAEDVVRSALSAHPDAVLAHGAVVVAESQRREVATFLGNPEVEGGLSVVGDKAFVQAMQPFSITGEGWFARTEAREGLAAAEATARRSELIVAAEARAAWARAVTAETRERLCAEALDQTSRLRAAVEERTAAGEASSLDAAFARATEAQAAARALSARRERTAAFVALSAFHPDAATEGVAGEPLDALPEHERSLTFSEPRSDVAAAEARVEAARASLSRAKASGMPLLAAGIAWENDGGETDLGPMASVVLPLWTRHQGDAGVARAEIAVAEADLAATVARAEAEARLADADTLAADGMWTRLDGLPESATAGLASLGDAFRRGELDIRDVVLFGDALIEGRLAWLDAQQGVVEVHLAALLAHDDPRLLGLEAP